MKGMVFTEFLEMVEGQFGIETLDRILDAADLPSGGVYSAVGLYDHREMVNLVVELSQQSGTAVPDLLRAFGRYIFGTFTRTHAPLIEGAADGFDFLQRVDREVHVEVLKLYPDAELPSFRTEVLDESTLQMDYRSDRAMGDLAYGLIEACGNHFEEDYAIDARPMVEDGKYVRFRIRRRQAPPPAR